MTIAHSSEERIGRRASPRLRLGVPARVQTTSGFTNVIMDDLSTLGAQLKLSDGGRLSRGFLEWLSFEVFFEVVWHETDCCGVQFDEHLPESCVLETRDAAPAMLDERSHAREVARLWAKGSLR